MTRLLVSVRDGGEARLALAAGADLIDAKDPQGALGALSPDAIAAIVAAVPPGTPTSAVAGDHDEVGRLVASARIVAATGVGFVKIGLHAGLATPEAIAPIGAALGGRGRFVAVLFADERAEPALVAPLAKAGFSGAMIDTFGKAGPRLTDFVSRDRLAAFVSACRREGMISGLAGSLRVADIAALLPLAPDYLGFRGGLCRDDDRRSPLDPARIRRAAELIAAPPAGEAAGMRRPAGKPVPTVVKIGGSLLGSPRLDGILATIVAAWHARPVVVAGGGLFADAVRAAQKAVGFDDRLAHRLALDAMGHVATILADRHPTLTTVDRPSRIANVHRAGQVPVWRPLHLQEGRADIPESWDVTSDSLALWLATHLGADTLVLVKSANATSSDPAALAAAGVVDAAFPAFAKRFRGSIEVVGPAADRRLHALLIAAAPQTGHAA